MPGQTTKSVSDRYTFLCSCVSVWWQIIIIETKSKQVKQKTTVFNINFLWLNWSNIASSDVKLHISFPLFFLHLWFSAIFYFIYEHKLVDTNWTTNKTKQKNVKKMKQNKREKIVTKTVNNTIPELFAYFWKDCTRREVNRHRRA